MLHWESIDKESKASGHKKENTLSNVKDIQNL